MIHACMALFFAASLWAIEPEKNIPSIQDVIICDPENEQSQTLEVVFNESSMPFEIEIYKLNIDSMVLESLDFECVNQKANASVIFLKKKFDNQKDELLILFRSKDSIVDAYRVN